MSALAITIDAAGVQVAPGATASFSIEVRNLGSVVDRYRCEIVGLDPAWWSVAPASLELFPQREAGERPGSGQGRADAPPSTGRFTVTLHPPRTSAALAGTWGIGAKVTSENTPTDRLVEETAISILPFGQLEADLRPAVLAGRFGANATVRLANRGNRPEAATLTGADRAEKIDFKIDRAMVSLQPGESTGVRIRLSSGEVKLIGGSDTRPFTIDVRAGNADTPPQTLSGTLERRAILPSGLPVAIATLAALAMGAVAIWFAFLAPKDVGPAANTATVAPPTPIVITLPPASATASVAPASASDSPSPSASPSPTPTERPFGPDTCISGFVWRGAFDTDHVCVTPEQRNLVFLDNQAAATRIDPGGAFGPDTCVSGFVWRGARPEDHVCVTPEERNQVATDNGLAASRVAP